MVNIVEQRTQYDGHRSLIDGWNRIKFYQHDNPGFARDARGRFDDRAKYSIAAHQPNVYRLHHAIWRYGTRTGRTTLPHLRIPVWKPCRTERARSSIDDGKLGTATSNTQNGPPPARRWATLAHLARSSRHPHSNRATTNRPGRTSTPTRRAARIVGGQIIFFRLRDWIFHRPVYRPAFRRASFVGPW